MIESRKKENKKNDVEPKKYMVDIMIPPECLDEDGGECPHSKKEIKKQNNPV